MLLLEVCSAFKAHKIDFVIVGGYAVALHGAVRGTVDVDLALALNEESFVSAEKCLNTLGLQSRLPLKAKEVFEFRKEYAEKRNLIAWSFVDNENPIRLLDILILLDARKLNKVTKKVQGVSIPIVSKEDLIQMKTIQKFQTQNLILDKEKNNPEAILNFINDFQNMIQSTDEKTKAISLRVPSNVLRMFKSKAARKDLKYQSVITSLMREWIKSA